MKNNRPIEVGQVRMMKTFGDGTGGEKSMYVILKSDRIDTHIKFLTGDRKYEYTFWNTHFIEEDIVVM